MRPLLAAVCVAGCATPGGAHDSCAVEGSATVPPRGGWTPYPPPLAPGTDLHVHDVLFVGLFDKPLQRWEEVSALRPLLPEAPTPAGTAWKSGDGDLTH